MELSEWITTADPDDDDVSNNKATTPFTFLKKPMSPLLSLTAFTHHHHQQELQQHHQEEEEQQQEQHQPQQREARFVCVISSPLGSSHVAVVENHEIEIAQHGKKAVSIVRYSEAGCYKGFPMMRGAISVKTTFEVTPAEHDPESIRVRVNVGVGEVPLRAPRWIKARVAKLVWAGGVKQAKDWLEEMTATEKRGEIM